MPPYFLIFFSLPKNEQENHTKRTLYSDLFKECHKFYAPCISVTNIKRIQNLVLGRCLNQRSSRGTRANTAWETDSVEQCLQLCCLCTQRVVHRAAQDCTDFNNKEQHSTLRVTTNLHVTTRKTFRLIPEPLEGLLL